MGGRFVETDGTEVWARIDAAERAFSGLLEAVGPDAAVAGSEWRASDVARHVLTVLWRYTRRDFADPAGLVDSAAELTELNDVELAAIEGMALPEILIALREELEQVRRVLPEDVDIDRRFPFHGGTETDAGGALANLIGELVVHGHDIAAGNRRPWTIEPLDARLALSHLVQVGPGFVRQEARPVRSALVVAGARPWLIDIRPAGSVSRPLEAGESVDVRVRAPARTALLAFHGRYGLLAGARHGMVVTGGRRPWRAVRIPAAIDSP